MIRDVSLPFALDDDPFSQALGPLSTASSLDTLVSRGFPDSDLTRSCESGIDASCGSNPVSITEERTVISDQLVDAAKQVGIHALGALLGHAGFEVLTDVSVLDSGSDTLEHSVEGSI